MEHTGISGAAVTIALALAAGTMAQAIARHVKLPGIVLLLGAGVLLGPDGLGLVLPKTLGPALQMLVGFAVAVILFEGGLNLRIKRLRREARTIWALLTVGALITGVGGALAARGIMGWDWRLAALFGSLVIVTGPTVVTPLLRRIRVTHRVETVLEAEGVFIDAIGAVVALVTLQVVISPAVEDVAFGALDVFRRIGFGMATGVVCGVLLALLLRVKRIVPEGLENVLTLSVALALFQVSNAILPESGITSVTAAGLVVGNMRTHVGEDLREFKEQLTVLFIGMLFVLLAADVRMDEVRSLGMPGVLTVIALMFLVRPLNVAASTLGSDLTWKERSFIAWLSPRGVVAAAVASLFAQDIADFGIPGGEDLRALVFLVIAVTVLLQGLTGGTVAAALGLRRPGHQGFLVVGANELGHVLGNLLRNHGEAVTFVDHNPNACHVVEQDGFPVVYGNPLEDRTLQRARVEDRAALVAVSRSDELNYTIGKNALERYRMNRVFIAAGRSQSTIHPRMIREIGGKVLFGEARDLELWSLRLRRRFAEVRTCRVSGSPEDPPPGNTPANLLLPLLVVSRGKVQLFHDGLALKKDDQIHVALFGELREQAENWLARQGWMLEPLTDSTAQEIPGPASRHRS